MFFYTSLFVASLIVALVILWLYNALMDVGRVVYRAMLPSSKNNITGHVRDYVLPSTGNGTPTPWGWQSKAAPAQLAKTQAATPGESRPATERAPWGWPGNNQVTSKHQPAHACPDGSKTEAAFWGYVAKPDSAEKANRKVGWPYREEKFEFAGKSYKTTRRVKVRKTNLSKTEKPWGW